MGFIYEAMERAKLAIQKNCRSYLEYWRIIDHRWNFQLHHDLHAAGYFLNPQYQYGPHDIGNDNEIMLGLKNVIQRLEGDLVNQGKALNQALLFRDKIESFGTALAQKAIKFTNPAEWWINYGESAPELRKIAIKVLSQTTSASNCERNWSTFSLIHTKTRNRLKYQKLHALVFVHYNMRLKIRNVTRKSQQELDRSYDPINLDYIFEEDDPLNSWLEERESSLLDGQPNPWLDDEEAGNAPSQLKLKDNKVLLVMMILLFYPALVVMMMMVVVIKVEEEPQLKEVVVVVHKIHLVKDKVELELLLNHLQCVHIKDHEALIVLVLVVLKHPKQEVRMLHMRRRGQLIH
ncbi:uncharacterized protein LOC110605086 [Manihot esculenta]|uniref:uncharacterized protein LOC110605086 n=1 Tax=Manihot esculenta TaxID=3983 RepID=UPI001CC40B52|nr:uncharacterized protein LOC110605086 [Manihot esculenta]